MSKSKIVLLSEKLVVINQQLTKLLEERAQVSKELHLEISTISDINSENKPIDLFTPIVKLGLSARACNCIRWASCETISDVVQLTANELLRMPNFGKGCLKEVEETLSKHGFSLKKE